MNATHVKLDEIVSIKVGYQARRGIAEDFDGEYILLRPQDFTEAGVLMANPGMHFSPTIDPRKYLIKRGDILVLARGQHHDTRLIVTPLENAVAANTFYIVRVNDQRKIMPAYLAWWLNQPGTQAYFHRNQGKSTIPFIPKGVLGNCVVQVPAMKTQAKIAAVNNLWQREQKLNRRLVGQRGALVQALCRAAVLNSGKE